MSEHFGAYTRQEAAAYLRISTGHLDRITKAGKIGYCRSGARVVYTEEQLTAYLTAISVPVRTTTATKKLRVVAPTNA